MSRDRLNIYIDFYDNKSIYKAETLKNHADVIKRRIKDLEEAKKECLEYLQGLNAHFLNIVLADRKVFIVADRSQNYYDKKVSYSISVKSVPKIDEKFEYKSSCSYDELEYFRFEGTQRHIFYKTFDELKAKYPNSEVIKNGKIK